MTAQPLDRSSGAWQELRRRVIQRDGGRCTICGATENLQADHVVELQDGGTDDMWNLTTLCAPHHRAKTSATRRQRAEAKKKPRSSQVSLDRPRLSARLPANRSTVELPTVRPVSDIAAPFSTDPRSPGGSDPMPYRCPPPHPDAAASMGDAAAAWIEARLKDDDGTPARALRWWQWFVLQRILEIDGDGNWCWPVSFVSVARQLGKSELAMELALWRCSNPHLFGGRPQESAYSSNTVTLSRRLQAARWPWALEQGYGISKLTGNTEIQWPDGSIWRTIAAESFYGRSIDQLLIDEVWHWQDTDFWQAAWPTSAARPNSHAILFSTAHEEPRTLVPTLLSNEQVCTIIWQAPPDADLTDRAAWRQASAHWDARRERVMAMSADQPSFATQFGNVWPAAATATRWMPEDRWMSCRSDLEVPDRPQVAAVDDRPGGAGAVVAFAWHDGDHTCVHAEQVDSLDIAWNLASRATTVMAGQTLVREPKARLLRAKGFGTRDLPGSLQALRISVMESSVRWSGDDLARSMRLLEVVEGGSGLRVVTGARDHAAVKCAAVAAREVRQRGEDPILV